MDDNTENDRLQELSDELVKKFVDKANSWGDFYTGEQIIDFLHALPTEEATYLAFVMGTVLKDKPEHERASVAMLRKVIETRKTRV